jgi:hypothetical protein
VSGHAIVHFPFLEILRDLLGSSKFTDVNNLCVNPSVADHLSQFMLTTVKDCSNNGRMILLCHFKTLTPTMIFSSH